MADPYATWAGATVILQDGKRLGWKVDRGSLPNPLSFADRYFGGFSPGECTHESQRFEEPGAFDAATAWCATFPAHEREAGCAPGCALGGRKT